jgi:hypothetical protein
MSVPASEVFSASVERNQSRGERDRIADRETQTAAPRLARVDREMRYLVHSRHPTRLPERRSDSSTRQRKAQAGIAGRMKMIPSIFIGNRCGEYSRAIGPLVHTFDTREGS